LKTIFDRFSIEGGITAAECCQALTEAGVFSQRRETVKYLKDRKHLGVSRSINFFEFIRAYAALRKPSIHERRLQAEVSQYYLAYNISYKSI
jgi:hypothetical protein